MWVRLRFHFVSLGIASLLLGCASQPGRTIPGDNDSADEAVFFEIQRELQSPTPKSQAFRFHQFVQGDLSPKASRLLVSSCSSNRQNPFCYSIRNHRRWAVYRRKRTTPPKPVPPREVIPTPLRFENDRIVNWTEILRAEKQSLIEAFEKLPLPRLGEIGHRAAKEMRCPNMAAIAAAATLEEYFPEGERVDQAALLYEHSARCLLRQPADRENFLVRAALLRIWRKDYPRAISILKRVNPSDAFAGRALYWLYRLYDLSGDKKHAQSAYRRLRARYPFSFHAIVAASENTQDPLDDLKRRSGVSFMKRSTRSAHLNRVITQIEILNSFGFDASSVVLLDWMLASQRRLPSKLKLYLAELGDFKIKVSTVPEILIVNRGVVSETSLKMAHPRAHFHWFEKYSGVTDPFLLMAISQKESKFDALAQSPANARGLMQLTPETAARLAGGSPDLFDPETNIRLGARYVEELLSQWSDRGFLVLANYNAGKPAVERWLRRYTTDDPLLFIDLIPYRETRDYVGYVLTNYFWYRRLYRSETVAKVVAPDIARR